MIRLGVLTVGAVTLCVWEAGLSRSSTAAHVSVAAIVVAVFLVALILGKGRQSQTTRSWWGDTTNWFRTWTTHSKSQKIAIVTWCVLIAAIVAWDVISFIFQAHALPTLSYFIGHVTRDRIGRGLTFAVWLSLGAYLALRWRTKASE